jgi:NADH dehydrogenase
VARRAVEHAAPTSVDVKQVDYGDARALARAAEGCTAAVHLVGILKETSTSRYVDAHEHATLALVAAARAARLRRIVYVSILGADPACANGALASKGRAERILLDSGIATLILRVPMVLGEADYASRALRARACSRIAWLIRGASLEQPVYAGDVVEAIVAGLELPGDDDVVLDLAGPESLSRADLVRRAGSVVGARPQCVSLPLAPVLAIVGLVERLIANPPVTRAMLEVLDHDDRIDPGPAAAKLGIRLTPLDEMLAACLTTND